MSTCGEVDDRKPPVSKDHAGINRRANTLNHAFIIRPAMRKSRHPAPDRVQRVVPSPVQLNPNYPAHIPKQKPDRQEGLSFLSKCLMPAVLKLLGGAYSCKPKTSSGT